LKFFKLSKNPYLNRAFASADCIICRWNLSEIFLETLTSFLEIHPFYLYEFLSADCGIYNSILSEFFKLI
jgi:hypothetical protein